jgi:hypothetical protein
MLSIDEDYLYECARDRQAEERQYKVIYDNGKPFETTYKTEEELKQGLKDFYILSKTEDYAYFDVKVYDFFEEEERDISENQFIEEMISEILEESEGVL